MQPHLQHAAERCHRGVVLGLGESAAHDQVLLGACHRHVLAATTLLALGPLLVVAELLQTQRGAGGAGVRAGPDADAPPAVEQHVRRAPATQPAAGVGHHHHRELESLGRVHGHQHHRVAALVGDRRLPLARGQVGLLLAEAHEPLQVGAAQLLVLAGQAHQLAHVGQAAVAVRPRQQRQVEVVLGHDRLAQPLQAVARLPFHQPVVPQLEGLTQPVVASDSACGQRAGLERADRGRPPGGQADQPQPVVRHPHQRRGQHRQQRPVVGAVDQQAQVGEQIAHLLLAVVAAAGGAHGGQALLLQGILVGAGVGARLEQQHDAARAAARRRRPAPARAGRSRPPRPGARRCRPRGRRGRRSGAAPPPGRWVAVEVAGRHQVVVAGRRTRGRTPRSPGRARAAATGSSRRARSPRRRPRPLLAVDLDVGTPEPVDALELVADQEQVTAADQLDQLHLQAVRVLELVHHHLGEPLAVAGCQLRLSNAAGRGRPAPGRRSRAARADP